MQIIREGPSASRPPVLDALVAGYDPPMITANGVSVPKPEVDWTDAEEQASVGNARARNAIFNGVDLNIFKLINSCSTAKEAWKTLEIAYEVSDYNKRVLEIANESLLLGEKIPDSKIVWKVLRSLPRKFDMKVTAIEEAHDITSLKLDELFGSLLTFEMAIADRESMNVQTSNQYQKRNDNGPTRRNNENSDRRSDMKILIEEVMVECPIFLRKQKKNFRVTLSDEESVDSKDDDGNINAFAIRITDENTDDDNECSVERTENLDSILKAGHNGSYRYGLGFVASASSSKATSEIKFVPASMRIEYDTIHTETGIRTLVKSLGRTCYYCSRKGHIRSYFTNLNDCVTRHVTFGDGAKGKIIAKGNIDKDDLPRLNDVRSKQGIFLGYSQNSRAYRVYNNRSDSVMETINVVINDLDYAIKQMNDEKDKTSNMSEVRTTSTVEESKADNSSDGPDKSLKKSSEETRRKDKIDYLKMVADLCYISTIELSTVDSALKDEYWLNAMQEELLQFRRNNVWTLISKPEGVNVIGTKWIFKNKTDETGCVTKNKAKLVVQGYSQVEGVDFDETVAPIARLKAIRLLLGISCIQKFKLYQMDVKSAFLNGYLNEEVYVAQPKGFVDSKHPKHVYKLNKALYGLKQAPRACKRMMAFSYLKKSMPVVWSEQAQDKRTPAVTHVKLTKDTEDPRITHLEVVKRILKYVHGTSDFGMMYSYDTTSTLVGYCDADCAGSADYRKTEYIATGSGCTQLIWMKNMLHEYSFDKDTMTLYCDNMSAIEISKNLVQHSRTKHIDIRHHFIRELVEDKVIKLDHIRSN
ncbi:putative mitochondrial protein [Cucumis melo var. makuwa]|uniref:Putative mitochondrial protein n=1 Tax=Cucumis melo var. makuwa TaxID=1194695 RepID=A0A5D3CRK1_CUCMM|nr:putative mitochondrial protein [Cucumis melo var. makuwa]